VTTVTTPLPPATAPVAARRGRSFAYWHEAALAVLLCGLMGAAAWVDPAFVQPATQLELASHMWEMALLALPMTLIIITGGIDLSVGSAMALCAVTLGLTYEAGAPVWIGVLLALVVGVAAGLLNGWFVASVRVHPLIVTLATLSAFRGIAEGVSLARPISGFPEGFGKLSGATIVGLPLPGLLFAAAVAVVAVMLAKTPFGRGVYAIGHNEAASRFSGIRVARVKLLLYTFSGLTAAVAAVLFVSRRNTAKADVGTGMELDVITAVVLGGTSIFGGRGTIIGTLLGVLLIHEAREFVSWRWNSDELNLIVVGTLLIAAVLLNSLLAVRGRRAH
jgi:rhamnose transport system permease protein